MREWNGSCVMSMWSNKNMRCWKIIIPLSSHHQIPPPQFFFCCTTTSTPPTMGWVWPVCTPLFVENLILGVQKKFQIAPSPTHSHDWGWDCTTTWGHIIHILCTIGVKIWAPPKEQFSKWCNNTHFPKSSHRDLPHAHLSVNMHYLGSWCIMLCQNKVLSLLKDSCFLLQCCKKRQVEGKNFSTQKKTSHPDTTKCPPLWHINTDPCTKQPIHMVSVLHVVVKKPEMQSPISQLLPTQHHSMSSLGEINSPAPSHICYDTIDRCKCLLSCVINLLQLMQFECILTQNTFSLFNVAPQHASPHLTSCVACTQCIVYHHVGGYDCRMGKCWDTEKWTCQCHY